MHIDNKYKCKTSYIIKNEVFFREGGLLRKGHGNLGRRLFGVIFLPEENPTGVSLHVIDSSFDFLA